MLDTEDENEITENVYDHLRYSIVNSGLCLTANIAKNAQKWKMMFGNKAYDIQAVIELWKGRQAKYDIEIQYGQTTKKITDLETQYMTVFNGKHGGGRMILNPMAIINDGYFEVLYYNGLLGFAGSMPLF